MKIAFLSMDPKGAPVRGAGYVAASIPNDHELLFYCLMNPKSDKQYKTLPKQLVKLNVDIIMVSTTTLLYSDASRFINNVKNLKNIPVLMGGVHPTVVGPDLLKQNPNIDYLCIGEGESFVKEFLEHYGKDSLFDIRNLVYRKGKDIINNPIRPPEDLSILPKFPWHLFKRVVGSNGILNITATRGCPYSCTYCCNSKFLKMYGKDYIRYRPVDDVIDEIKFLKDKYKFNRIHFGDDMVLSNVKYVEKLFTTLKTKLNIPHGCMCRVECIDEKMVELLKRTGCKGISLGVECGDEPFRKKYLNRFMSNTTIEKAFRLLREAGISTVSFNMIGWPVGDHDKLTKATADLNKKIKPDFVQVTWFYPFQGTKLYDYCVEHDLIDKNKSLLSYHKESVLKMYKGKKSYFKSHGRKK
jgi:anaerobic magnesium-protoporphyrin IX monomethyl ester cyclase